MHATPDFVKNTNVKQAMLGSNRADGTAAGICFHNPYRDCGGDVF
jgi:hypothetical protein